MSRRLFAIAALCCVAGAATASLAEAPLLRGKARYYAVGLGACGWKNRASEFVVAVSPSLFDSGHVCGKKIVVKYKGKSAQATIVDRCPGCKREEIDLSKAAFRHFDVLAKGVLHVEWKLQD